MTELQQQAEAAARAIDAEHSDSFGNVGQSVIVGLILKHLAPLEAQLKDSQEQLTVLTGYYNTELQQKNIAREERDEARREVVNLKSANETLTAACDGYKKKVETQFYTEKQLTSDNQQLQARVAELVKKANAFIDNINNFSLEHKMQMDESRQEFEDALTEAEAAMKGQQ